MKKCFMMSVGVVLLAAGCRSIGPDTVARDRFDYTTAISDSVKNQLLLNLVKLRYGDMPLFVDVSSVISQYSMENGIEYNFQWEYPPILRTPSVGGSNTFTDRPTITYTPLTGDKFSKSILTPIPPSAIFFLVQSGRSVDSVFFLCIQSINGINNRYDAPMRSRPMDPEFVEVLAKMRRIQDSGMIGMRIQTVANNQSTVMYFGDKVSPEIAEDIVWVKQKLELDPQVHEYKLVYGSAAQPGEIAILSRSVMEIMVQLASSIEIPSEDLQQNRAYAIAATQEPLAERMSLEVHSGKAKPADVYMSIAYRNKWFWIDDTDLKTKQLFSGILMLLSLMESDKGANQPVLTVSTG
jgi:hypothetical protein